MCVAIYVSYTILSHTHTQLYVQGFIIWYRQPSFHFVCLITDYFLCGFTTFTCSFRIPFFGQSQHIVSLNYSFKFHCRFDICPYCTFGPQYVTNAPIICLLQFFSIFVLFKIHKFRCSEFL